MTKLVDEIKTDLGFIRSHTLQPRWFKVLKILIVLGFPVGYALLFGLAKTVLFVVVFFLLSALVHMVYRAKTNKWKQSWLDFVVVEKNGEAKAERIGKYYYTAVVVNAIVALAISQLLV
ncbi:MAG: hypothetical protein KKA73_23740 [Chloroflexi bacterium]|nr:hypothetical protein [Chloroflexota bacterium]MBU1750706.1 hypothetical protein [Chloroflexota bacterium]MBU1877529.1 hypothetical protein [Chloroflexota bacterium]